MGGEAQSGLDDTHIAWWLANDRRLADVDHVMKEDPAWCCPICSEGLEAEGESGWVVQICGNGVDTAEKAGGSTYSGGPPLDSSNDASKKIISDTTDGSAAPATENSEAAVNHEASHK